MRGAQAARAMSKRSNGGTSEHPPSQPITILSGTTDPNMEIAILQCQSGHLSNFLINTCHEHICALDAVRGSLFAQRAEVTWVPTGTMKKADSVLFPCMYAASGCKLCEFQPFVPHLMQQHKSITTLQVRSYSQSVLLNVTTGELLFSHVHTRACLLSHFICSVNEQTKKIGIEHQDLKCDRCISTRNTAKSSM
uniref:Uncharacterized protein n=1 Tax=Maylandia zebra TaxID=106582 RepID=A0A3P9AUG1_9CICH